VVNDPDVRGLTVYVQNQSGAIVSRKVQYQLAAAPSSTPYAEPASPAGSPTPSDAGEKAVPAGDANAAAEESGPAKNSPETPMDAASADTALQDEAGENEAAIAKAGATAKDEAEAGAGAKAEASAKAEAAAEAKAIAEEETAAKKKDDSAGYGVADAVEGGADTDTADSTDTTKANAIAETDAGTVSAQTETAKAAPAQSAPPPAAKPVAETPEAKTIPEDQTIQVKQLDQYLPAFRIFEGLAIGRYSLVFQVQGENEILYKTSKPIYFLADADFALGEIQSYLPGTTSGGRLIPPGINVMLEADINADERLDPYVIWYAGKKIIAQGRASGGANYLLWKTPDQTGFHIIRAEVFPLLPEDRVPENIIGKVKDLSLAVSSKSEGLRHFSNSSGDFVSWYQFWGTLEDSVDPRPNDQRSAASNGPERKLVPQRSQAPRWVPYAGMYGLLVSPEDVYALPGKPFSLSEEEQGAGRIFLHFAPLAEGTILNIRFNPRESIPGGAVLNLSLANDVLTLRLSVVKPFGEGDSLEESLRLNRGETEEFITAIVNFDIAPQSLGASLILENPARETKPMALALDTPINGEGTIHVGSGEPSARRRQDAALPELAEKGTAIFNELALAYTRRPISQPAPENDPALAELSAQIPTAEEASPSAL
jgi:hypothetical protein